MIRVKFFSVVLFLAFSHIAFADGPCGPGYQLNQPQLPNVCEPTLSTVTVTATRSVSPPNVQPQMQNVPVNLPQATIDNLGNPTTSPNSTTNWGPSSSAQSAAAEKAAQAAAQQAAGNGSGGNQQNAGSGDNNNTAPAQSAQPASASAATGPSCQQAQELANQCCNNPSACLLSSNSASQSSSMATAMIQMALGVGANLPGNVAGMCGQAKDVSYVSSALNAYLANQCRAAIESSAPEFWLQTAT